jgi:hypothetical protein
VDAADFKTDVFSLLFFKRISDVHDEELGCFDAVARNRRIDSIPIRRSRRRQEVQIYCVGGRERANPVSIALPATLYP